VPAAHAELTGVHALPPFALENDVPATHAAHVRSAVADPTTSCPWPTGHVCHAAQESKVSVLALSTALNFPSAQFLHTVLLVVVATAIVLEPAGHFVAVSHALPSSTLENDVPATHTAHVRSAEANPAADCPEPAAHVFHAAHDESASVSLLAPALNCPLVQGVQATLDVAVATALV
jgi:hypothetical protein